ncbi:MAG: S9 family peptidase [Chloroflexota bacterium]|nr:S9 family peptidase [Chloroflexota bacterium]
MSRPDVLPYGSWKSPITADLIASKTLGVLEPALVGDHTYWVETRPAEEGRYVLVHRSPDGTTVDAIPEAFSARTRVHEYGGGAYAIDGETIIFSNWDDQRVYRQDPGEHPRPITPELDVRYADGVVDPYRNRLICVREDHRADGEALNSLVSIDLEGQEDVRVLVSGDDFYAAPRLSPDGSRLAWLSWNHPNMPWNDTQLWVGELAPDGSIGSQTLVAGSEDESIFQPQWSPNGVLTFISDRTNWWNLYRLQEGTVEPLTQLEAEFGRPQWVFRAATYDFVSPDRIICSYTKDGDWHLAILEMRSRDLTPLDVPYTDIGYVRAAAGRVAFCGGSPTEPRSVVQLDLDTGDTEVLRRSSEVPVGEEYLSRPRTIDFPTEGGWEAHAFFYPPKNPSCTGPAGAGPPLLVISHGGPTSATTSTFNLAIQYWTSRGIAVLDVNYRGSTGYGRDYRQALEGEWGIADVEDCVNGALYLVDEGQVNGERLIIRGGSAGGYTTLCVLCFRDEFQAGASYYGVSDLEALTTDTHKFESRYLDRLVGPYPEREDLYRERSPIHHADQLSCPVIFFQGLDDRVVPPNQSETMAEALRQNGVPVAYVPFEGEQHGFRRASSITRALEAELYFYSRVFGFELAEPVEPVQIENLGR